MNRHAQAQQAPCYATVVIPHCYYFEERLLDLRVASLLVVPCRCTDDRQSRSRRTSLPGESVQLPVALDSATLWRTQQPACNTPGGPGNFWVRGKDATRPNSGAD